MNQTEADLTQFEFPPLAPTLTKNTENSCSDNTVAFPQSQKPQQRTRRTYKDQEITVVDETNYNDASSFSAARKLWNFNKTGKSNPKSLASIRQNTTMTGNDHTQNFELGKALINDHLKFMKIVDYSKQVHKIETTPPKTVGSLLSATDGSVYLMFEDDIRLFTYDAESSHNIENCLSSNLVTSHGGKEVRAILTSPAHDIVAMSLAMTGNYQLDLFIDREFVTNFISSSMKGDLQFKRQQCRAWQ